MKLTTQPGRNRRFLYTGIILVSLGLALLICSTSLYEYIMRKAITLTPTSTAFTHWRKTDKLIMDFYFFNWTNPQDVHVSGVKPHVEEIGPYRFKFDVERVNVTWPEDGVVKYQDIIRYYWDEESPRNLNDSITTINVIALVSALCKTQKIS